MADQHQPFAVTFQHEQQDSVDQDSRQKMVLDQDGGWTDLTGYLTEANTVRYIGSMIYGSDYYDPIMDCGLDDGKLVTTIYAFPYSNRLQFNIYTSYGDLIQEELEYPEITSLITFNNSDSGTVSYPIYTVKTRDWLGAVYDENSNKISSPSVTFSGDEVHLSRKVHGSLEFTYTTKRFKYRLEALPRDNVEDYESKFDTYVWATYHQGLTWLKVSEPPNADDVASGPCGYDTKVQIAPPDLPDAEPKDKNIEMDYCALEEIGDGEGVV